MNPKTVEISFDSVSDLISALGKMSTTNPEFEPLWINARKLERQLLAVLAQEPGAANEI